MLYTYIARPSSAGAAFSHHCASRFPCDFTLLLGFESSFLFAPSLATSTVRPASGDEPCLVSCRDPGNPTRIVSRCGCMVRETPPAPPVSTPRLPLAPLCLWTRARTDDCIHCKLVRQLVWRLKVERSSPPLVRGSRHRARAARHGIECNHHHHTLTLGRRRLTPATVHDGMPYSPHLMQHPKMPCHAEPPSQMPTLSPTVLLRAILGPHVHQIS